MFTRSARARGREETPRDSERHSAACRHSQSLSAHRRHLPLPRPPVQESLLELTELPANGSVAELNAGLPVGAGPGEWAVAKLRRTGLGLPEAAHEGACAEAEAEAAAQEAAGWVMDDTGGGWVSRHRRGAAKEGELVQLRVVVPHCLCSCSDRALY